jgi:hypothetical protein
VEAITERERLIDVDWGSEEETFPIPIIVKAYRRPGLVDEMAAILRGRHIIAPKTKTVTERQHAHDLSGSGSNEPGTIKLAAAKIRESAQRYRSPPPTLEREAGCWLLAIGCNSPPTTNNYQPNWGTPISSSWKVWSPSGFSG